MLVLLETPAGFGLFRVKDDSLMAVSCDDIASQFEDTEKAKKCVELCAFSKFSDTKEAAEEATALIESKLGKGLKKFLKSNILKKNLIEQLAVCDKSLGGILKKKLGIDVVFSANTTELIRGIRLQLNELVTGLNAQDTKQMALGLSHSLNRFKLKFSPEKVDTMIIQAVGLLDDLDRELNNFGMRLKEWYGWHFPELAKIVTDNSVYASTVKKIGYRTDTKITDLGEFLPSEIEAEVKQAAEVSMGTEIGESDLERISEVADRVLELYEYRNSLADYLKFRMNAIAPNLTHMVGELVGARLISHSGSLMGLAKHPSSTVQILGAEKALFRALKTKSSTPKYGLIYHATLVGQCAPKLKGKISRVLAAKLALCIRVDALGEETAPTIGIENRMYVERKLAEFQDDGTKQISKPFVKPAIPKYEPERPPKKGEQYDTNPDDVEPVITEITDETKKSVKRKKSEDGKTEKKKKKSK